MREGEGGRGWRCVRMNVCGDEARGLVFFSCKCVSGLFVCLCTDDAATVASFWAKLPGKMWQKVQITSWRQLLQTTCCEVKNIYPHLFVAVFTPARSLKTTLQAFVSVHAAVKTCVAELKIAKLMSSKNIHISTYISDLNLNSFIYLCISPQTFLPCSYNE